MLNRRPWWWDVTMWRCPPNVRRHVINRRRTITIRVTANHHLRRRGYVVPVSVTPATIRAPVALYSTP